MKKPEPRPTSAASVKRAVPGFRIRATPINPTSSAIAVRRPTFSFSIGMAISAINSGEVAFSSVDSDRPILPMAKKKQVMAQILITPRNRCTCNTGVFRKAVPRGRTMGRIMHSPTTARKNTSWTAGNSLEAILIQVAMTAKQQAEPKAGRKPWIK